MVLCWVDISLRPAEEFLNKAGLKSIGPNTDLFWDYQAMIDSVLAV